MSKTGIYTKKGDSGETIFRGNKVPKCDASIQALGAIDELNSIVGLTLSYCTWSDYKKIYREIQQDLFVLGALIAGFKVQLEVDQERIAYFEEQIDEISAELEPLHNFILPGGRPEAAWLHFMRSVCRRAEVAIVELTQRITIDKNIIIYLNRLSDLFFVLARKCNGGKDCLWSATKVKGE